MVLSGELLDWNSPISIKGLARIYTLADGHCFFHSLLSAFDNCYLEEKVGDIPIKRADLAIKLREEIAKKLQVEGVYESLYNGELAVLGKEIPEFSRDYLIKELLSNNPVSYYLNELISDFINKDIYFLDSVRRDVINLSSGNLYKNRKSIVILYMTGHYELCGIIEESENETKSVKTLFNPDDDLIVIIKNRLKEITKE